MDPLVALSLHIVFGGLSILIYFFLFFWILGGNKAQLRAIKIFSILAFLALLVSWFTGGYYYIIKYPDRTKTKILEGANPWAHNIIMETKEHVFLFLPFVSFLEVAYVYNLGSSIKSPDARKSLASLVLLLLISSITIAGMGYIISGIAHGVRWFV